MLTDFIVKEISHMMNIKKGTFLNKNCLQFIENMIFRSCFNFNLFGFFFKFPAFFLNFWTEYNFPDFIWKFFKFPDFFQFLD